MAALMTMRLLRIRSVAIAFAVTGLAASAMAGDRVTLSKPGEENVAPKEADPVRLQREGPNELRRDPAARPQTEMPYVPPIIPEKRKREEPRNIFGDPLNPFTERRDDQTKGDENPFLTGRRNDQRMFGAPFANPMRSPEKERALSPIREFDWNPDKNQPGTRGAGQTFWSRNEPDNAEQRSFGIFGRDSQSSRDFGGGISSLFKPPTEDLNSKRDADRAMERSTEFQKLINPSFSPLARSGVDPVSSSIEASRSVAPVAPIAPAFPLSGNSLDPMRAYKEQQDSLRGPTIETLNRRSFGIPSAPRTDPATASSMSPRTPLMRQPTFIEMPGRNF